MERKRKRAVLALSVGMFSFPHGAKGREAKRRREGGKAGDSRFAIFDPTKGETPKINGEMTPK